MASPGALGAQGFGAPHDLFASATGGGALASSTLPGPLAVRMRPHSIDQIAGQRHLLHPGSPLHRLLQPGSSPPGLPAAVVSLILWGPPGTGKTSIAQVIARSTGAKFVELSAVNAGVKQVRQVMDQAHNERDMHRSSTVLFLDEIHRFSKAQQDSLLPGVENGWVTLVAATTENPSFSVVAPLVSRSLVLTLQPLSEEDLLQVAHRALQDPAGLAGRYQLSDQAAEHLIRLASGDARRLLTGLEAAAGIAANRASPTDASPVDGNPAGHEHFDASGSAEDVILINTDDAQQALAVAAVRYDKDGDQHYDVTSAFIKSLRGSDVDAALHYLARMIQAGEDPRFIARRIMIAASEEVGMADPTALQAAVAAAQAVALIGMPEARIILVQAVVHVATAPKSNACYQAIEAALADVQAGRSGTVPLHLRDAHYPGARALGHGQGYRYAHDAPHAVAPQRYLPDTLADQRYYHPHQRGFERDVASRVQRIRHLLSQEDLPHQ